MERLNLMAPSHNRSLLRHQVVTTDKLHFEDGDLPENFEDWKDTIPDAKLRVFDDTAMVQWFHEHFGGTEAERIFLSLRARVMWSDFFRCAGGSWQWDRMSDNQVSLGISFYSLRVGYTQTVTVRAGPLAE